VSCWNSNDGYDDDSPLDIDVDEFPPIPKFPRDFAPEGYVRTDHEEEAPLPWWGFLVGALFVIGVTLFVASVVWRKLA